MPEITETKTVTTHCPGCGSSSEIIVNVEEYERWQDGEKIQIAMPELTADQREMLMTGTCNDCWDRMFGGLED